MTNESAVVQIAVAQHVPRLRQARICAGDALEHSMSRRSAVRRVGTIGSDDSLEQLTLLPAETVALPPSQMEASFPHWKGHGVLERRHHAQPVRRLDERRV